MVRLTKSSNIMKRSVKLIPGGVNSPVRAFKSVGGIPPVISRAYGSKIYDIDGNEYIDYVGSWGPMILGHAHPEVIEAVKSAVEKSSSFGAPTESELELAKIITRLVPSIKMVRLVNSGTEAAMSAVRLARGYTGRDKIIKFEGCYHGHYDSFLIKAGSGALTFGLPGTPGVPAAIAGLTYTAEFNNIHSVNKIVRENEDEIAAVIIEPVPGNMGCIKPSKSFLKKLRELCSNEKILLIFDEVMSGFRVSRGGAQELFQVKPDITVLGKIIGGGMPIGAYGGSRQIMSNISPAGNIYQAGTLSGNPAAVAAGLKTLRLLQDKNVYIDLEKRGRLLEAGIKKLIKKKKYPLSFNRVGSMFTLFFNRKNVRTYKDAVESDTKMFALYFKEMLNSGIYIAPSQFEAGFISAAHSESDIEKTYIAAKKVLNRIF